MAKRKPANSNTATLKDIRPRKGTSGESVPALPTRAESLQKVVTVFLDQWKSYVDDENCDNPTDSFWDACKDVVDLFGDGDIPHAMRDLSAAVEDLGREAYAFEQRSDANNFYPQTAFWKAVEVVSRYARATAAPEKKPPLESMHELANPKPGHGSPCSHAQIALIWGVPVEDVSRELAKPGSVCTPEYCAGVEARRFKQSASERFGRDVVIVDKGEVASMLEAGTGIKEICETTGATPDQVAEVKRMRKLKD